MPLSTSIFQEGLVIPPVKIVAEGEIVQGVMDLFLANVRTPLERQGDFAAQMRFTPWTSVWNLSGRPAVSLPATMHVDEDGTLLPVGVMLGARYGREDVLLGLARTLEEFFGWQDKRPPVA